MKLKFFCLILLLAAVFTFPSVWSADLNETSLILDNSEMDVVDLSQNMAVNQNDDKILADVENIDNDSSIDLIYDNDILRAHYNYTNYINPNMHGNFTLTLAKDNEDYICLEINIAGINNNHPNVLNVSVNSLYGRKLLTDDVYTLSIYYHGDEDYKPSINTQTIEIDPSIHGLMVSFVSQYHASFFFFKEGMINTTLL